MDKLKIKDFFKNKGGYLYYVVGEGLSKGIVFLLLAFYTNYLGKEDFGKLALFWVSVPLISVLVDLSQRSYVKYHFIHQGESVAKLLVSVRNFCLLSAIFLLAITFFKDQFDFYLIDGKTDLYVLFSALFFAIIELYLSLFQIRGEYKSYNLIFVFRNALPYIIAALIIKYFSGDVFSFMKTQLAIFIIITLVISRKDWSLRINFKEFFGYIKPSVRFSTPFIPAMISVMALSFADRFIINYYYTEVEVAEYTVAYTVSSIFMAFFLATNKMWQKFILESLKANERGKIMKTTKVYLAIVLTVGIVIALLRGYLVSLMSNNSYIVILDIIPIILFGMFFYFLYTVLSNIPFYYKGTIYMALPAVIAAILNILLNFVFIPRYGYKVAAVTTAISYFIEFLVIYLICLRKYKIDLLFNGITKRFTQSG